MKPNRLSKETSPYLKQHQNNPVDWYPWGEEAHQRARAENKPILLSVGYSACHWCHVMEHESFENQLTAELMNRHFINIKVDREERPDLDQIYQNVAQALTGGGGWPLTVFLTPELKPFYGGTYFPPEDRYGRIGFPRLLEALADVYLNKPELVAENSTKLTNAILELEALAPVAQATLTLKELTRVAEALTAAVDFDLGGLGGAPKFPNSMTFTFLWRMGLITKSETFRSAAAVTLDKMARGGIYDQLGGGFHRYSVDDAWAIPHFEKMLYDNGLLLKLYSEVLLTAGPNTPFESVVRETSEYLIREMRDPGGAFYAATDADSEGEEGKYFAWTLKEIQECLTKEEAAAIAAKYGVTESGNFEHGSTVLFKATDDGGIAIDSARQKLLKTRSNRVPPQTDTKILVSSNALAISGLALAGVALKDERYLSAAKEAYGFIRERASCGARLFATIQEGEPKFNAYLDDYAFMAQAAIDLYRVTLGEAYLEDAKRWMNVVHSHFKDPKGGYYFTSDDHESLLVRPKTLFDQAIPSGTAVALQNWILLGESARAQELVEELSAQVLKNPHGSAEFASSMLLYLTGRATFSGQEWKGCFALVPDPSTETKQICFRETCFPGLAEEELWEKMSSS